MGNAAPVRVRRRTILYLEPRPGTPLRTALDEFRSTSAHKWGPTDAHAYHPHCSVTGFWEHRPMNTLTNGIDGPNTEEQAAVALVELAINAHTKNCAADQQAGTRLPPPTVLPPLIPPKKKSCLILPLKPPTEYTDLAKSISHLFGDSNLFINRLQPKRCDHISLAYYSHDNVDGVPASPQPSPAVLEQEGECFREMRLYADEVLAPLFAEGVDVGAGGWDLVYYDLVREEMEPRMGGEHEFKEIRRWPVA
ncbi:hypothetical protein PhCBS80983_g04554 [Powellomyces hirtus]|uniref:Uncharacterized protein n=1 Tax=Powellomyces hirtus TaxID=109895 RepID=A0A507DYX4_9FUNG|nr:hypothetical protein PhCBS80983_g04554 [Powellomyces hirtus]